MDSIMHEHDYENAVRGPVVVGEHKLVFPGWQCSGHNLTAWGDTPEEATENWIDGYQEMTGWVFTGDVPVAVPTCTAGLQDAYELRETQIQRAKTQDEPKTWIGRLIAVLVGTVIGLGLLDWIGMDP